MLWQKFHCKLRKLLYITFHMKLEQDIYSHTRTENLIKLDYLFIYAQLGYKIRLNC